MSYHRIPLTSSRARAGHQGGELEPLRAARVTCTALELISIDRTRTVTALQQGIGCRHFDVLSLPGDLDFYVDDEGAINGSPLNLPLTIIAHILGTPAVLFGTAIALGCNPDTGDSTSLTDQQLAALTTAASSTPTPDVLDRLTISLAPLPHIIDMLRTL